MSFKISKTFILCIRQTYFQLLTLNLCIAVYAYERFGLLAFVPQGNKEVKSPKSPLADIPAGGTRNIKSMWEKGIVSSPLESPAPANKDVTGIRGSVAGRINSSKAKPAETEKTPAPAPAPAAATSPPPAAKPAEAKPGEVGKRGMWETKRASTPAKVAVGGKSKFN
ncbi:hypothetical protein XENOCAPTIV_010721 [Xenoophorus captivus]|uniref:Uncharacterized protein n=1 Tax=Xenoophorus captivus TaxID=1517983 RepID=A0ABV0RKI8_9TELE